MAIDDQYSPINCLIIYSSLGIDISTTSCPSFLRRSATVATALCVAVEGSISLKDLITPIFHLAFPLSVARYSW
jgi:hypothetical protein